MTVLTPSLSYATGGNTAVLPGWANLGYDTLAVHAERVLRERFSYDLYVTPDAKVRVWQMAPRDVMPVVVAGLPGAVVRGWAQPWTYHLALGWPVEGDL